MRDDIAWHVSHLKEEIGFLRSTLDSHIEKFGAINQEGRKIIEVVAVTQQEANRSLETSRDYLRHHVRVVVFIVIALAAMSGTVGYQAVLKCEMKFGTWVHQLLKTWSPRSLCLDMGFQYETGLEDNIYYCIRAITWKW